MKQLVGIPESMLIPLIARAKEYENEKPIIKDALSKKIFDGLDDMYKNVTCDDMSQIGISIRTVIIDCVTKRLIKDNKDLIVVNIGCGLDTRFQRFNKRKNIMDRFRCTRINRNTKTFLKKVIVIR